jgi:hypothetical protein
MTHDPAHAHARDLFLAPRVPQAYIIRRYITEGTMDITLDDVRVVEISMRKEIDRTFTADIDTLIKTECEDDNASVQAAEEKYKKLLDRVYLGKNKWRMSTWEVIESKIRDEGPLIYDMDDATAICTYALYIEAAFLYLRHGTNHREYRRLVQIVREDIRRLGAYVTTEHTDHLTEDDQQMVFYAITMCRLYLEKLATQYPDT